MITDAAAVAIVPEPKVFDKGLIFVKDTDILLSGDKWTIVVNIALDDYSNLVDLMKYMISHVLQKIQGQKGLKAYSFDIHWEKINRLNKLVEGLDIDLRSFQKLLFEGIPIRNPGTTSRRGKRGLLNILGYGMKYLFGTADAKDVKRLAKVCDELHSFESRMTHAVEHQLTYIRTLDEMNRQNMKDTVELAKALLDSISNFSLQLNRIEADEMKK